MFGGSPRQKATKREREEFSFNLLIIFDAYLSILTSNLLCACLANCLEFGILTSCPLQLTSSIVVNLTPLLLIVLPAVLALTFLETLSLSALDDEVILDIKLSLAFLNIDLACWWCVL